VKTKTNAVMATSQAVLVPKTMSNVVIIIIVTNDKVNTANKGNGHFMFTV